MTNLISHTFNNTVIHQRADDRYVNLTEACQAHGKLIADYLRLDTTRAFLDALSSDMGIPISQIVQVKKGRTSKFAQGTFGHPLVAVNLGQWLSPQFAVAVSKWVFDAVMGGRVQANPPTPSIEPTHPLSLSARQRGALVAAVKARVQGLPKENHGAAFPRLWNAVNTALGVASYKDIDPACFDTAVQIIQSVTLDDLKVQASPSIAEDPIVEVMEHLYAVIALANNSIQRGVFLDFGQALELEVLRRRNAICAVNAIHGKKSSGRAISVRVS